MTVQSLLPFQKKLNPQTVKDFSFIKITDELGIEDYSVHYKKPELSASQNQVYIYPDFTNMIQVSGSETKKIAVKVCDGILDTDGISVKNDVVKYFKVNSSRDSEPPVISSIILKNVWNDGSEIPESDFTDCIKDQAAIDEFFSTKYRTKRIMFKISGYDTKSGIQKVTVKERLLYDVNGIDTRSDNIESKEQPLELARSENNPDLLVDYNYECSSDIYDGIIELTVTVYDNCNNKISKVYHYIKDTTANCEAEYDFPHKLTASTTYEGVNNTLYFRIDNDETKESQTAPDLFATWDGTEFSDTLKLEYIQLEQDGDFKHGNLFSKKDKIYKFDNVDNTKDGLIKAFIKDDIYNYKTIQLKVKAAPSQGEIIKMGSDYRVIFSATEIEQNEMYEFYWYEGDNFVKKTTDNKLLGSEISDDKNLKVYVHLKTHDSKTFAFYSDAFTYNHDFKDDRLNHEFFSVDYRIPDASKTSDDVDYVEVDFSVDAGVYDSSYDTIVLHCEDWESKHKNFYFSREAAVEGVTVKLPIEFIISNLKEVNFTVYAFYDAGEDGMKMNISYPNSIEFDFSGCKDVYKPILNYDSLDINTDDSLPFVDFVIADYPENKCGNLIKDKDSNSVEFRLYYRPALDSVLDDEAVMKLPYVTERYAIPKNVNNPTVSISLKGVFENLPAYARKNFDCFVYLEDNSGNYRITKFTYKMAQIEPLYDGSNKLKGITLDDVEVSVPDLIHGTMYQAVNSQSSVNKPADLAADTFVKVTSSAVDYLDTTKYVNSTKQTCEVKNYYETDAFFTVFSNKKVFVHTVWNPINYENNVTLWETNTADSFKGGDIVLDPSLSGNMANYEIPVDLIPSGMYYTTIVYFADNTSYITSVKRKD